MFDVIGFWTTITWVMICPLFGFAWICGGWVDESAWEESGGRIRFTPYTKILKPLMNNPSVSAVTATGSIVSALITIVYFSCENREGPIYLTESWIKFTSDFAEWASPVTGWVGVLLFAYLGVKYFIKFYVRVALLLEKVGK